MTRAIRILSALALSSTVAGCGLDATLTELDAEKELMLSAISSEREALVQDDDQLGSAPDRAEPDQPRLDGDCDVQGHFEQIFARYDEDTSGELEEPEEMDVSAERDHRSDDERMRRIHAWVALEVTFDADDDGALSEAERQTLMDDFTIRCEVMQERILADFDADGDGELSEAEMAEAEAELEARRAEHEAEREAQGGERGEGPPEGAEGGERGGEQGGERPDGPPSMEELRAGFLSHWDTDGDGETDADERAEGRADMRERITSGAPLGPDGGCQRDGGEAPSEG